MRWKQERPSFDDQHAQANVFTVTIKFVGDVAAEHASSNNDNIKRVAAIAAYLRPRAAHPSAEQVVGERCLLDIYESIRVRIETR